MAATRIYAGQGAWGSAAAPAAARSPVLQPAPRLGTSANAAVYSQARQPMPYRVPASGSAGSALVPRSFSPAAASPRPLVVPLRQPQYMPTPATTVPAAFSVAEAAAVIATPVEARPVITMAEEVEVIEPARSSSIMMTSSAVPVRRVSEIVDGGRAGATAMVTRIPMAVAHHSASIIIDPNAPMAMPATITYCEDAPARAARQRLKSCMHKPSSGSVTVVMAAKPKKVKPRVTMRPSLTEITDFKRNSIERVHLFSEDWWPEDGDDPDETPEDKSKRLAKAARLAAPQCAVRNGSINMSAMMANVSSSAKSGSIMMNFDAPSAPAPVPVFAPAPAPFPAGLMRGAPPAPVQQMQRHASAPIPGQYNLQASPYGARSPMPGQPPQYGGYPVAPGAGYSGAAYPAFQQGAMMPGAVRRPF